MSALRYHVVSALLLLGLGQPWQAQAACRLAWSFDGGFRDAQGVYEGSNGLKALGIAAQDPNNSAAVQNAIDGISFGAYGKYGVRVDWVPDKFVGMDGRPAAFLPGKNFDPGTYKADDTILLTEGLKSNPALLLKTFTHEYGRLLLGRYYLGKYLDELAREQGRPLSSDQVREQFLATKSGTTLIPRGPQLGTLQQLDYVVEHQGLDPGGNGPGAAPPPPPPPPPPPSGLGQAITDLRAAGNMDDLRTAYAEASARFSNGDAAAELAKVYQQQEDLLVKRGAATLQSSNTLDALRANYEALSKEFDGEAAQRLGLEYQQRVAQLGTASLRDASSVDDLRSTVKSLLGQVPDEQASQPLVDAFQEKANQFLETDLSKMRTGSREGGLAGLKKAYRQAIRSFHPDIGQEGGEDPRMYEYFRTAYDRLNTLYERLGGKSNQG